MHVKLFIVGIILIIISSTLLYFSYSKVSLKENLEGINPRPISKFKIIFNNVTYKVTSIFILKNNLMTSVTDFVYIVLPRNTTYQSSRLIYSSPRPLIITKDEDDNIFLVVKVNASINEIKKIIVKYIVNVSGYRIIFDPNQSIWPSLDMVKKLTIRTNFWDTENPAIIKLSYNIGKGFTPLTIVYNIAKWMSKHIRYEVINFRLGSDNAIKNTGLSYYVVGDCVEVADSFVTLARIRGIPARTAFGIYLFKKRMWLNFSTIASEGGNIIKHWGGHMWPEVYLPPWGWVDVELLESPNPEVGNYTNLHILYGIEETKYYGTTLTNLCIPSYLTLEYIEMDFEKVKG